MQHKWRLMSDKKSHLTDNNAVKMKKAQPVLILLLLFCFSSSHAHPNHRFFRKIDYHKQSIISLDFSPLAVTSIHFIGFQPIDAMYCGDPLAWDIHRSTVNPFTVLIKPRIEHSNTNLLISLHDKMVYFNISTDQRSSHRLYNIDIIDHHPHSLLSHPNKKTITIGRYCFHGDEAIRPLWAYDNTRFTFLRWKKQTAIPAILRVTGEKTELSLTNYHVQHNVFRLPRVSDAWLIKRGASHGYLYKRHGRFKPRC